MQNIYVRLFLLFFKINLLTPSGPASYGLTQKLAVPGLISQEQFTRFVALAAGIPGSDAVQMAWLVGYEVSKIPGALVSVLGALLPCILLVVFATFGMRFIPMQYLTKFFNGVKPALFLLLLGYAIQLITPISSLPLKTIATLLISYILIVKNISPVVIVVIAGIIGLL